MNGLLCIWCDEHLNGRQTKFCSTKCKKLKYHQDNPDYNKDKNKEWRLNNHERHLTSAREYYKNNLEQCKIARKEWKARNTNLIAKQNRIWYSNNSEHKKAYNKKWYEDNPYKRIEYENKRRQAITSSEEHFTSKDVKQMLIDQNGLCAYCEERIEGGFHVDHMMPLSKGGSNSWDNVALACSNCNLSKGNKTVEEFMERRFCG